jgi:hypothetical protein
MNRWRYAAVMLGLLSAVVLAPAASAHSGRPIGSNPSSSVFPAPRDPWRSWGAPHHVPRQHVDPQHVQPSHGPGAPLRTPIARRVWIPGQWVSDGYRWVWTPGHWAPVAH